MQDLFLRECNRYAEYHLWEEGLKRGKHWSWVSFPRGLWVGGYRAPAGGSSLCPVFGEDRCPRPPGAYV